MKQKSMMALRTIACGWLAFLCSFVDRLSWPPIIPMAAVELRLTAAEAGGFMSAFFFGYLLTQLPGGMLADRWGTRKVLLVSLFVMGLFTMGLAVTNDFGQGVILRFLAGFGSGAVLAAAVKGVYDHVAAEHRAMAMGFFMTSAPLGLLLANLLSPLIAAHYGWRTSFLFAGSMTLAALGLTWLILPRRTGLRIVPAAGKTGIKFELKEIITNRELMLTAAAGFFAMWGTWGTLTWANAYMHQGLGLSLKESGRTMALFGIGALIGQPVVGWLSDRFRKRRRQASMVLLGVFAVLLWLFAKNQDAQYLAVLATLLGAGAFMFGPVLNTFISELVAARSVATAVGFCNGVWQIGSLISPVTAGLVLDQTGSYVYAFSILAAGPLVAVGLLAFVRSDRAFVERPLTKARIQAAGSLPGPVPK
ncbi:MFS transporter [Anaerospora hongkongensis]|uniref:MFS transporter n=1 Tax=Anaerospora hongkongensis TaxID=244830 RepID=UPI00289B0A61|nr:MFS transporter [Anaerospora hongkongensis]